MAGMAVFNVAGYLIIEESRRSTVISASVYKLGTSIKILFLVRMSHGQFHRDGRYIRRG